MSDHLPVLDQKKALQQVSGNESLANDLLAMFIKELPGYKEEIQKHLIENNREELRNIIHKIHGGLRYLGAPALLHIIAPTDVELFDLSDAQLANNIKRIFIEIDKLLIEKKYNNTTD